MGELEILGREVTVVGQILLLMVLESSGKRKITWRASEEREKKLQFLSRVWSFSARRNFYFLGGNLVAGKERNRERRV